MPEILGRLRTPRLSAAPSSPALGEMYYDTGTNKLYWWNGTAWIDATGGGAAAAGAGPFVFQQQNNARNAGATDQSIAFTTKNTTVGSIFVFVAAVHGAGTFSNMRDSSGNTWTVLGTYADASNSATYGAWACPNATGGLKQTATVTVSGSFVTDVWLFEFTGVSAVAQDGVAAGVVTTARPIVTPAFTSSAGALWFNASIGQGSISYNAPWTGFIDSNGNGCGYYITPGGPATPNAGDSSAGSTGSFVFGLKASSTGAAEVFTGPSTPTGGQVLWIDTDEVSSAGGYPLKLVQRTTSGQYAIQPGEATVSYNNTYSVLLPSAPPAGTVVAIGATYVQDVTVTAGAGDLISNRAGASGQASVKVALGTFATYQYMPLGGGGSFPPVWMQIAIGNFAPSTFTLANSATVAMSPNYVYAVWTSGGTVTLPLSSTLFGNERVRVCAVMKAATVNKAGGETATWYDQSGTLITTMALTQGQSAEFMWGGSNWFTIQKPL